MTISKKDVVEACAASFQRGYVEGVAAGRSTAEKERGRVSTEMLIKLASSVGQAMDVNASLLRGLAAVFDDSKGRI